MKTKILLPLLVLAFLFVGASNVEARGFSHYSLWPRHPWFWYYVRPTQTPKPTVTPKPTKTPRPTVEPSATPTPEPTTAPTPTPSSSPDAQTVKSIVTYYGWPDNDPAGRAIAYPIIHNEAGGTGTYSDPITFASDNTFTKGQILYVPYIQKYVIREDLCASCKGNWIDIWMESDSNYKNQVISCEEQWTHWKGDETEVEVNPPSDRPVDTTPLFDKSTGVCRS